MTLTPIRALAANRAKFIAENEREVRRWFRQEKLSCTSGLFRVSVLRWIDRARREIGYSDKTTDADIYRSLWKACRQSS